MQNLFLKKSTKSDQLVGYNGYDCTSIGCGYVNNLISRLLKATLSSLNNQEKFEKLFQFDLINSFLKPLIIRGSLRCYIYTDSNNIAYAIHSEKTNYPTLSEVEIDIKGQSTHLYKQIEIVAEALQSLVQGGLLNIHLTKSIVFKMDGARKVVSKDETEAISNFVGKTLQNNSILVLDSKDVIENGQPNLSSVSQSTQMGVLFSSLSATTGFPLSYFTGDYGGGIATTENIENTRLFEAKELFFMEFLKTFFNQISLEVQPKIELSDKYSLSEIQNFLTLFDDRIDVDETLKNLGFTLKKRGG